MRELVIKWLREGLQLTTGQELYIPVDSLVVQKDTYQLFRKELEVLKHLEPEEAVKLRIFTTYRDGKHWVGLKKVAVTPLVAFKKDTDGTVAKITITNDRDSKRLEALKLKDKGD